MEIEDQQMVEDSNENLHLIINTDAYPIHDFESKIRKDLIAQISLELEEKGCARIPNFIRNELIQEMVDEAKNLHDQAF